MFSKRIKSEQEVAISKDLQDLKINIVANYYGDTKNEGYKTAMAEYKKLKKELSNAGDDMEKLNLIDNKVRVARNSQKKLEIENSKGQDTYHK
jgi:hypothetical protein